ncbi:MAG: hypothetical protein IID30_14030, partial [Planctomycetes bacterium]|nr:hypothetical protein [Planctomycetota bacterium]
MLSTAQVITPVIVEYMIEDDDGVRRQVPTPEEPKTPPQEQVELLLWVVVGFLSIHFSRMLINGLRSYTLGWLGQRITYDLQTEIFSYLQLLSLSFYSRHSTGRIMTRVTTD